MLQLLLFVSLYPLHIQAVVVYDDITSIFKYVFINTIRGFRWCTRIYLSVMFYTFTLGTRTLFEFCSIWAHKRHVWGLFVMCILYTRVYIYNTRDWGREWWIAVKSKNCCTRVRMYRLKTVCEKRHDWKLYRMTCVVHTESYTRSVQMVLLHGYFSYSILVFIWHCR